MTVSAASRNAGAGEVAGRSTRPASRTPVFVRSAALHRVLPVVREAPLGALVQAGAGMGSTTFARALAAELGTGEVRWLRGNSALRDVPGGAVAALLPGAQNSSVPDEARILQSRLAVLRGGGVLGVDGAEFVDERSAALIVDITAELGVRLVLAAEAGVRLPDAFGRAVSSGELYCVELDPLDTAAARQLVTSVAGGPIENSSADRLVASAGASPLLIRLHVQSAESVGALTLHEGTRVLAPDWLPEPVRWRSALAPHVPRGQGEQQEKVLHLIALLSGVHADVLEALGLLAAAEELTAAGVVQMLAAQNLGWERGGAAFVMDRVRAMAKAGEVDSAQSLHLLTELRAWVDPNSLPDVVRARAISYALFLGMRFDYADLVTAYLAAERSRFAELQILVCRMMADHALSDRPDSAAPWGYDPAELELAHSVAARLSWQGDAERTRRVLEAGVAADHPVTLVVAAACELDGGRDRERARELLDRALAVAGPDTAPHAEARGWALVAAVQEGHTPDVDELLSARADDRLSSWLRAQLAATAMHALVITGRAQHARELAEQLADPVRRNSTSHREQAALWHSAFEAMQALGLPPAWLEKLFSPDDRAVLTVPPALAHIMAGSLLADSGQVVDAMTAYSQALALLSASDPLGLTGIALTDRRRAGLQLPETDGQDWRGLLDRAGTGSASGPRRLALLTYNDIVRLIDSGATAADERAEEVLAELREHRALHLELAYLHKMWRFGLEVDTARIVAVAEGCDGRYAAAIADQVRGLTDDAAAEAAVDGFEACGRLLLAAEAAMVRSRTLSAAGADATTIEAAMDRARDLTDRLGPVFTPMLGLRSTADPALSLREREIAELVADGLSNREIAEQLSLSRRTVDAHMSRIMARLGLSSRKQLRNPVVGRAEAVSTGHVPGLLASAAVA